MITMEMIRIAMEMDDDIYYGIVDLLGMEDEEGYPMYSVEEIAEQFGVAVEVVQYIDRSEYCDL